MTLKARDGSGEITTRRPDRNELRSAGDEVRAEGERSSSVNISVAMCTYNGEKFLGAQLKSISEQAMRPYEMVICDDGSTDSTLEIVKAFADEAPFPVRFLRNEATLGSTKNFEKAICLCTGDAIALCDQDDIWHQDKLELMGQVLELNPDIGGVFSDASLIDENSKQLPDSLWGSIEFTPRRQALLNDQGATLVLLEKNAVTGATFLFRSQFIPYVTPIPAEWVHDAWIVLLISTLARVRALPDRLMSYRLHRTQQIGVEATSWYHPLQVDRGKAISFHKILTKRWSSLSAKLATAPVNPMIRQLVKERLEFLQARAALREQSLIRRFIRASAQLPGYFRFSKGLLSYCRDVTRT
jgi:glycosyltransferase involved in cell wall biosynthesis